MAQVKLSQTGASFSIAIEEISKVEISFLPQFIIQDIPWGFLALKKEIDNETWLNVYVYCKNGDTSRDWGIAAASSIQLISSRGKTNNVEKMFAPYFFEYTGKGYGFDKFIKWDELFDEEKGYVENDTINFNIQLVVLDQNAKNASKLIIDSDHRCEDCSQVKFGLTISNIDQLMAVRTSKFELQNSLWDLTVLKHSDTLGIRVCRKDIKGDYNVTIDFRMKSSKAEVQEIKIKKIAQLKMTDHVNVYSIISWNELFKPENGFVVNHSISFEVKIKVDKVEEAVPNAKKRCASNLLQDESNAVTLECAICLENIKNQEVSSTDCGHSFCSVCIEQIVQAGKPCPSCNTKLTMKKLRRSY